MSNNPRKATYGYTNGQKNGFPTSERHDRGLKTCRSEVIQGVAGYVETVFHMLSCAGV